MSTTPNADRIAAMTDAELVEAAYLADQAAATRVPLWLTGACVDCGTYLDERTGGFFLNIDHSGAVTGRAHCKNAQICANRHPRRQPKGDPMTTPPIREHQPLMSGPEAPPCWCGEKHITPQHIEATLRDVIARLRDIERTTP